MRSSIRNRIRLPHRSHLLTIGYIVGGAAFLAFYFAILTTSEKDVAYQVPGMIAPLAIGIGIRRYRPAEVRPWVVLAIGLVLSTLGDWTWVVLAWLGQEPFPSVADALYLGGLVLVALAVLDLVRGRIPGGDRAGIIDALIVAIGVALVSWTFLMQPLVEDPMASAPEIATALAYPAIDILLLGVLVRMFLVPARRGLALNLILLALTALLLSDFPYAVMVLEGTYVTGHLVELGWLVAPILWGAAALHPSMRRVAEPVDAGEERLPAWRLALLAAASLMAPAVLVIEGAMGRPPDIPAIAVGCVLLFLLVIARLGGVVRDLRATLHERSTLESALHHRALHDPLTGLANRTLLQDRLQHAVNRRGEEVAVFFLDLDDFKGVNDTLGHHAGDILLTSVADAIRGTVRAGDTVARLGGDEFAVLVDQDATVEGTSELASRILTAIAAPIDVAGRERTTNASIGIAIGSSGDATAESLMRQADIAMYVAKAEGKGRFTVYDPARHESVVKTMGLQADIERGVADGEFELYYQPIIELASGELAGVEALLRWHHPSRGLLAADDFIHVAETSGAIVPIGRWVLASAAERARGWSSTILADDRFLSVNLSGYELADPGVTDAVGDFLRSSGLDPSQVLLEISESVRPDSEAVARTMREVRNLGIRLAIDDFGTGFGSVSRLLRHLFDAMKVDGSLVSAMHDDPRAEALVTGVIDLARRLGSTTIAEGVETAEAVTSLRQMGCELAQGYIFAPPMPAGDLESLLIVDGVVRPPVHMARRLRATS
jgi:diguanylate cyclase (GGDEF)-like protein